MTAKSISACVALVTVVSIGWAAIPSAMPVEQREQLVGSLPECRHGQGATPEDQGRSAQALKVARAITAVQSASVRRTGQYQPLAKLGNLPALPTAFELNLLADGSAYIFALKDTQDPCWFAVFSDQRGLLYEKSALNAPVIAQ